MFNDVNVQLYRLNISECGIYMYCDMTPESRNSEVRIDVHY
jgi:hypothetical protein